MLLCLYCSLSAFSQFTRVNIPSYPGWGTSFEQGKMDFGDMLTGYFSAYVYFSPSSGGELWFYQTVDGGATWVEKDIFWAGPSCLNRFLYAVNRDTCFIDFWTDYSDHFKRVSNSGMTWYSYFNSFDIEPRNIRKLNDSVLFMTAKHWGLTNGPFSYLYRIEGNNLIEVFYTREDSLQLLKPLFISPDTGFIISFYPSDTTYTILRTFDSGLSWQPCFTNDSLTITDIGFFTQTIGLISCSEGHIFRTIDAGTNWEAIELDNSNKINCLDFVNQNIGYCGGNNGSFYVTSDQGQSWDALIFPYNENIYRLKMFEQNNGYIFASFIYRYSDNVSLSEPDIIPLSIFPNPTGDIINIESSCFSDRKYDVSLINAIGKLIYSDTKTGDQFRLDMSCYPTGIYFLIVKDGTAKSIKKIIRK